MAVETGPVARVKNTIYRVDGKDQLTVEHTGQVMLADGYTRRDREAMVRLYDAIDQYLEDTQ